MTAKSDRQAARRKFEEAGVATIGGPDFGVHGEGYIRLSYANSRDNILRALARIDDVLRARSPTA